MSMGIERTCPECGTEQEFWLTARTSLHLGEKRKWDCPECDYGFIKINDAVDSSA